MLNRTSAVKPTFSLKVGLMRLFRCVEISVAARDAIGLKMSRPSGAVFVDTEEPGQGSALRLPLVAHVFGVGDGAKIGDPVIRTNAVDVVGVIGRKFTVHIKPSEAVEKVAFKSDLYSHVSIPINASNRGINRNAVAGLNQPRKNTSQGIVMKQLFEPFLREDRMLFSHAVSPVKKWFGQRPGSVSALVRLRYFNALEA